MYIEAISIIRASPKWRLQNVEHFALLNCLVSIISKEEDSFRSDSKFSGNKSSILPEGVEDSKSSKKTMLRFAYYINSL